jgi:hypothetical protein
MVPELQIRKVKIDGGDGLIVTFSDGTKDAITELLELRPNRKGHCWQDGFSIYAACKALGVAAIANHRVTSETMSDPNPSFSIDRDQAILLAGRVFAAFLLFWVVEDITEPPRELFSLTHYIRGSTQMGMSLVQALRSSYLVSE